MSERLIIEVIVDERSLVIRPYSSSSDEFSYYGDIDDLVITMFLERLCRLLKVQPSLPLTIRTPWGPVDPFGMRNKDE